MNAAEQFLESGQTAIALMTSALDCPDPRADAGRRAEIVGILNGQDRASVAITAGWLARIATQAILDKHQGSRENAAKELQAIGLAIADTRDRLVKDDWEHN